MLESDSSMVCSLSCSMLLVLDPQASGLLGPRDEQPAVEDPAGPRTGTSSSTPSASLSSECTGSTSSSQSRFRRRHHPRTLIRKSTMTWCSGQLPSFRDRPHRRSQGPGAPCEIYGVTLLASSATSFVHLAYLSRHGELARPRSRRRDCHNDATHCVLRAAAAVVDACGTGQHAHRGLRILLLVVAHFFPGHVDAHIATADPT